jgi:hypothetical protein
MEFFVTCGGSTSNPIKDTGENNVNKGFRKPYCSYVRFT